MKKLLLCLMCFTSLFGELSIFELKNTLRCVQGTDREMVSPVVGAMVWHSGWLENVYRFGPKDSACVQLIQMLFYYNEATDEFDITKNIDRTPAYVLKLYGLIDELVWWYAANRATLGTPALASAPLKERLRDGCKDISRLQAVMSDAEKVAAQRENHAPREITPEHAQRRMHELLGKRLNKLLTLIQEVYKELQRPDAPFPAFVLDQILVGYWFAAQEDDANLVRYMRELAPVVDYKQDSYVQDEVLEAPALDDYEKLAIWFMSQEMGISKQFPPKVNQGNYSYGPHVGIPDCVESTVRNILNLLIYVPGVGYDLHLLPATANKKLIEFYTRYPVEETHKHASGQAWFNLIASLKDDDSSIHYARPECEADGDEENVVKLLNALLGTKLTKFEDLETLSTPERPVEVDFKGKEVDGVCVFNVYKLYIGINAAKISLSQGHAQINFKLLADESGMFEKTCAALQSQLANPLVQTLFLFNPELSATVNYKFVNYWLYGQDLANVNDCVKMVEQLVSAAGTMTKDSVLFKTLEYVIDELILKRDVGLLQEILGMLMQHCGAASDVFTRMVLAKEPDKQNLWFIGVRLGVSSDIIDFFITHGIDVQAVCDAEFEAPALLVAVKNGRKEVTEILLAHNAWIDVPDKYGRTALMYAAYRGFVDILELLLSHSADVKKTDYNGYTALMLAIENQREVAAAALLAHGATVDAANSRGETALFLAVQQGLTKIVESLLAHHARVDLPNNERATALMVAAEKGYTTIVDKLLDAGADMNARDTMSYTALLYALKNGHKDIADTLIARGAVMTVQTTSPDTTELMYAAEQGYKDLALTLIGLAGTDCVGLVNRQDSGKRTALMYAAKNGHKDIAELLSANHALFDVSDYEEYTALMYAAENGHKEIVELLIAFHAGVDVSTSYYRKSALILAAGSGHEAIVDLLIGQGAEINKQDFLGETALMKAAACGHITIARMLLAKNAHVDTPNRWCDTALTYAADRGYQEIVHMLLDHKAEIDLPGRSGKTALLCAAERGYVAIVDTLLARGADIGARDNDGMTALMLAAREGYEETVKFFLAKNVSVIIKNKAGQTAFDLAHKAGHAGIAARLKVAGDAEIALSLRKTEPNTNLLCEEVHGPPDCRTM